MKVRLSLEIPATQVSKVVDVKGELFGQEISKADRKVLDDAAKSLMPKLKDKAKEREVKWNVRALSD